MSHITLRALTLTPACAAAGALIIGCSDASPTGPTGSPEARREDGRNNSASLAPQHEPPTPAGLVTLRFGGAALTLWPYTGDNFSGTPQDPINAVFSGFVDPLRIRAALRRLDGNRTAFGFPAAPPFNCTWRDAIGDEQTAFAAPARWTGSAVQLSCGEYGPVRFHTRLFREGRWTIAGTHMDLQVPGTTTHQVISWELPEQLLAVDILRTGLLAGAPGLSAPITQTPAFREIPAVIYNGLPPELRALIGGPPGDVTAPVPIPNDGRARLFAVARREPIVPDVTTQDFVIQFNQTIPKPFCARPNDFLFVRGPVHFRAVARVTSAGIYHREHQATAELTVVPVDPSTGQPIGRPRRADVFEQHLADVNRAGALAFQFGLQLLFKPNGQLQASQLTKLSAGTIGVDDFQRVVICRR